MPLGPFQQVLKKNQISLQKKNARKYRQHNKGKKKTKAEWTLLLEKSQTISEQGDKCSPRMNPGQLNQPKYADSLAFAW